MTDRISSGLVSKPREPRRRRCVTMNWRTSTASSAISKRPKGSTSYAYRCPPVTSLNSPRCSMAPILALSEIGGGRGARKRKEWGHEGLRRQSDQSYRRRQRDETQSREVPTAPRSAGEVNGSGVLEWWSND